MISRYSIDKRCALEMFYLRSIVYHYHLCANQFIMYYIENECTVLERKCIVFSRVFTNLYQDIY